MRPYSSDELRRLKQLVSAGAHIVLPTHDRDAQKRMVPSKCGKIARGWRRRATWKEVKQHLKDHLRVGVVPGTTGCVVLDQDEGRLNDVVEEFGTPLAVVKSRREGGHHLWYRAANGVSYGNGIFYVRGEKCGEVRCDDGYVILWSVPDLKDIGDTDELDYYGVMLSGYREMLPEVRRGLMSEVPEGADRSRRLWGYMRSLAEVGMTVDELVKIVKPSAWNKWGEDTGRLRKDVRKAVRRGEKREGVKREEARAYKEARASTRDARMKLARMDEVVEKEETWLWQDYIPEGSITWVSGEGSSGKSWFTLWLAAIVSSGGEFPDGRAVQARNVLVLSSEDHREKSMKKKLRRVGVEGDERRIWTTELLSDLDVAEIDELVGEVSAGLVILDPLQAFMSGADSNSQSQMRGFVTELSNICVSRGATVVGVRHHRKSGSSGRVGHRSLGSMDLTNAARAELSIGWMPKDPLRRRAITVVKGNLSEIPPPPLGFRLDGARGLEWLGPVRVGAGELLAYDPYEGEHPEAVIFEMFSTMLADGDLRGGVKALHRVRDEDLSNGDGLYLEVEWNRAIATFLRMYHRELSDDEGWERS